MKNKKLISSVIAVALAAGILLGGTFAWQSISQQALNEVYGFVNPGGRLHDDFTIMYESDGVTLDLTVDGTKQYDKNVYVENFTTLAEDGVQVFARIRLDEYMEIGPKAGDPVNSGATPVVFGADLNNKTTWKTHIPDDATNPFHAYWVWTMGGENGSAGSTVYMPTFDKNKDSLRADVNGSFAGVGGTAFDDYVDYSDTANASKTADAYYDNDDNTADEVVPNGVYTVGDAVTNGFIRAESETHTAKSTLSLDREVITMAEWLALPAAQQQGNYWVWDVDGWAYWANPVNPDTATGLFLDGIARTSEIINEDWYYGINVVAQFVTADDLGRDDDTGFYDAAEGAAPSTNALKLLAAIGVDVNTTVTVGSDPAAAAVELSKALDLGGNVAISGAVDGDTQVLPWGDIYSEYTSEYVMANGGTLNGGTVKMDGDKVFGLVVEAGADSTRTTALNNVAIEGNSETVLYVGENGGHVTLNGVNVTANGGAGIYAEFAQGGVTLNNCTVNQNGISAGHDAWFQTAVAAAQGADITINGGIYTSSGWAVYCFEGANPNASTVTINDGTFSGKLQANNNDKIIIKGGTFSNTGITDAAEFAKFVADGYKAVYDDVADTWTVTIA